MTKPVFIDTHCHIDQYEEPLAIIRSLDTKAIVAIAVTTSPSAFEFLRHRFADERHLRFPLGVHPLHAAALPESEWTLFNRCLTQTRYVGEVGLDFSPLGIGSRIEQERAFRRVPRAVAGSNKMLSIHSRRAEATVLDLLLEFSIRPAVFHWYSGPLGVLDHILEAGHYCSVNPAMVRSTPGRKVIERLPKARVLVETDGPYVKIGGRPATPTDVELVYRYLAGRLGQSIPQVVEQVYSNFMALLA
jgi:TatD DNase family protein